MTDRGRTADKGVTMMPTRYAFSIPGPSIVARMLFDATAIAALRFLRPMTTCAAALREPQGHRRVNAFKGPGMRCGKAAVIGLMICLATFCWTYASAQPAGSTKQSAGSQTKAAEAEALELNRRVGQLTREGRIAEAILLAKRALDLSMQVHGKFHRNVSADLITLASLYIAQGDYFNAEPLISQAIDIDKQVFGPGHAEVALDIAAQSNLLRKKGDYQGALRGYREALDTLYKTIEDGKYVIQATEIHYSLGKTLSALDRYDEAMVEYATAVQVFKHTDKSRAAGILVEMAEADRAHGNHARAKAFLDLAQQLEGR
jgi:tetratricopeptide (TPR) repeat protein